MTVALAAHYLGVFLAGAYLSEMVVAAVPRWRNTITSFKLIGRWLEKRDHAALARLLATCPSCGHGVEAERWRPLRSDNCAKRSCYCHAHGSRHSFRDAWLKNHYAEGHWPFLPIYSMFNPPQEVINEPPDQSPDVRQ